MRTRSGFPFVLCVLLIAARSVGPVHAEAAPAPSIDPRELEAFLDDYLGERMTADHVAGAVVAVVKDGRPILTKGYGFADVTRRIPVDPEKTVFVLGSLSKVFTWTAVMQLVEQGRLDPDADINSYLDFAIPAMYPEPITLNHLMSHTSGFEDVKYGQMAAEAGRVTPLGRWLKTHVPSRVRAPGRYSAYENYGTALAGYIVERVSLMKYDDYIEKKLLSPLGMVHTTSRQPVPEALADDASHCYLFADGVYQPQTRMAEVAPNVGPAASFRSCAADMARFMIAHLNDGRFGEAAILKSETARLMHSRSFSHAPQVNGMAHGFWELDMNGRRIIGHAGSHFIFNSFMMLFPDEGLGVFIATNSRGGSAFVGENYTVFEEAFVDRFFPADRRLFIPPADFADRAARFNGSFRMTYGRSDTTPEKLLSLMMSLKVRAERDGLRVSLPSGPVDFVQEAPLVFRRTDMDAPLVFRANKGGAITEAFYGPIPLTALLRSRWFETPVFNLVLLGSCFVLFLSFLIRALSAFFGRRTRVTVAPARLERAARLTAVLASLLCPLVLSCAVSSLFDIYGLYVGELPLWKLVQVLSIAVTVLASGMGVFTVLAWKRRFWTLAARFHYTLVTLAALSFVAFMCFWNLLGKSL